MVQLLVGLGNPGSTYAGHRHNVGFWLINRLADLLGTDFSRHNKTQLAKTQKLYLAKPQSYMNVSGLPVRQLCDYFKVAPQGLMIAHDDLDLPVGSIRIKQGGGHGGHNGLRDVITHLGQDFWRMRIGIGHPGRREQVHGYVLGNPSAADKQAIEQAIEQALGLRNDWLGDNIAAAQQQLHTLAE